MSALTGKHILVLGLGESGLAMARWCALRGARVRVADSRALPPGLDALKADAPLAELFVGGFGDEVLDGVDLVALSPGLDPCVGVAAEARRRGCLSGFRCGNGGSAGAVRRKLKKRLAWITDYGNV